MLEYITLPASLKQSHENKVKWHNRKIVEVAQALQGSLSVFTKLRNSTIVKLSFDLMANYQS